mgnify:CR=1 FL=1
MGQTPGCAILTWHYLKAAGRRAQISRPARCIFRVSAKDFSGWHWGTAAMDDGKISLAVFRNRNRGYIDAACQPGDRVTVELVVPCDGENAQCDNYDGFG